MSKFSPMVRFETEFQGDVVTMNLKSLSRKDFFDLLPFMENADDDGSIPQGDALRLVDHATGWLPKYVEDFHGLTDDKGFDVDLETAIDEVFFIELISEIVMKVINISQVPKSKPGEDDRETAPGKSAGPLLA